MVSIKNVNKHYHSVNILPGKVFLPSTVDLHGAVSSRSGYVRGSIWCEQLSNWPAH